MDTEKMSFEWLLPLAGPLPEGMEPPALVVFSSRTLVGHMTMVAVGAPVRRDNLLSQEEQDVLRVAGQWRPEWKALGSSSLLWRASMRVALDAYANSKIQPDPLTEARRRLEKIVAHTANDDDRSDATAALEALDKLGDKA